MDSAYGDGLQAPTGVTAGVDTLPSPRLLSNIMGSSPAFKYNVEGVSEMTAAWAQFLHDDLVRCSLFLSSTLRPFSSYRCFLPLLSSFLCFYSLV
jgi:hypothetical protein